MKTELSDIVALRDETEKETGKDALMAELIDLADNQEQFRVFVSGVKTSRSIKHDSDYRLFINKVMRVGLLTVLNHTIEQRESEDKTNGD